ncbi:MAG: YbaN family protein [Acidimicrobiia bacterium]|nr:YbaN family protein [Acidimicrobiia bacterium]
MWFGIGWVAVGVGFIGVVVPGLPTTGFMVFAAWCFSKSSPRFERWLLDLRGVGPLIRDYRAGLGMPKRTKTTVIVMIVAAVSISAFVIDIMLVRLVVIAAGVFGVYFVGNRVPTRPVEL